MEEFSNHRKIIDAKVQLLINIIRRRDNTIDPNTFEVNVGGKVMLFRADRITE